MCREKIRKAKAQTELSLMAGVKENKKLFCKYMNSKRRTKDNLHSLLDAAGNMTTEDKEKAEAFSAIFTSIFKSQTSYLQRTPLSDLVISTGVQTEPPMIWEDAARDWMISKVFSNLGDSL